MSSPHDGIQSSHDQHGVQSDAPQHGHHEHHAPAPLPFSDADVAEFRKEDVHAGKMVVVLMAGIFLLGVFIYFLVALSTWQTVGANPPF